MNKLYVKGREEFRNSFLLLHYSDQAQIFSTMDKEARARVYTYLSATEFARIFGLLDTDNQKAIFLELNGDYATSMLNEMFTDDIVNFFTQISSIRANEILEEMDEAKRKKVQTLLAYEHETAGAVMTHELISISATQTVTDVLKILPNEAMTAEIIYYLYVSDANGILNGVVSLRDLIIANPDSLIGNIMRTNLVYVSEDTDQEEVAHIIKTYDLLAIPVISKEGYLLGIVTVDDVLDILERETTEDFGEISATKGATDINLTAFTAAKKRSPWIIVLMFFGLITGGVIGRFEDALESVVLLAAFIPMIMDSGGNVGTQSLAVSVRGLALGTIEKNGFWRMVKKEFATGAMVGFICMLLITVLIMLFYKNAMLGVVVGVSIFFTLSISAVIGAVIPLIINKLKFDPAIASGPFITTLNDIIGLLIYFTTANYLIPFL